jgi:hypothetical protein
MNTLDRNVSEFRPLEEINNLIEKVKAGDLSLEMTKREKRTYDFFKALSKIAKKDFSEKEYLTFTLKEEITAIDKDKKERYCQEYGHKEEEVVGMDDRSVLCLCGYCKDMYSRFHTKEEWRDWNKKINTPMTI